MGQGVWVCRQKEGRKVSVNTMFEPGSISKSLNAVGILQLAQQGKLDLYQDINQYRSTGNFLMTRYHIIRKLPRHNCSATPRACRFTVFPGTGGIVWCHRSLIF
ncbi:serine hydrolase [Chitinophaga sedimenti]|uniref:serine hydrolase n=1 Tax=Chitinophaga sedimenti TaxID=2033606 RepID=UPI003558B3C9